MPFYSIKKGLNMCVLTLPTNNSVPGVNLGYLHVLRMESALAVGIGPHVYGRGAYDAWYLPSSSNHLDQIVSR